MSQRTCLVLAVALLAPAACATRRATHAPAAAERGMQEARQRVAFLPMLSDAQARATMPGFQGKRAPNLARVAAYLPETWRAEMAAWRALQKEGTLDRRLLSEVFYVVSSANDCFY